VRAAGPNAGLLTAALPEFAALLAAPPDPGDPLTAQARIQCAAVDVLRVVAPQKRPVVVFVDDLQWAGCTPSASSPSCCARSRSKACCWWARTAKTAWRRRIRWRRRCPDGVNSP
jgi:hypothetical protein